YRSAMNKNVATLLCVDHAELADFGAIMARHMQQSAIADLSAHFCVTRCLIENDIQLFHFAAGQNSFDNCFGLEKIIAEEFCRRGFQPSYCGADFHFFLS